MNMIVVTKFCFKLTILICGTKFAQKDYFLSKMQKVNVTIEICISELLYIPSFDNFNFLNQFGSKRYFRSKTEKGNTTTES